MTYVILAVCVWATYRWWNENQLIAWIAAACTLGFLVAAIETRTYLVREAKFEVRNIDVYLRRIWGVVGWLTIFVGCGLLIASFF